MTLSTIDINDFAGMAQILGNTENYRVLRKIVPPGAENQDHSECLEGIILDLETTGLDYTTDEILELGMIKFYYSPEGKIKGYGSSFNELREPTNPISREISNITGITQDMVEGKTIDCQSVSDFIEDADLIIAHNAGFDRKFAEMFCSAFENKPWACSMASINWSDEGIESNKLAYIAMTLGMFYDRHRALNDCAATLEILKLNLPISNSSALATLLTYSTMSSYRIEALQAPYAAKDVLKKRGYKWFSGNTRRQKCWWTEASEDCFNAEVEFLTREIYDYVPIIPTIKVTAMDRYSVRGTIS